MNGSCYDPCPTFLGGISPTTYDISTSTCICLGTFQYCPCKSGTANYGKSGCLDKCTSACTASSPGVGNECGGLGC
jgi:hypothetical protein